VYGDWFEIPKDLVRIKEWRENAAQISVYDGGNRLGFRTPARECLKKYDSFGEICFSPDRFNQALILLLSFQNDSRIDNPNLIGHAN
jgi:hypothetical protein